MLLAQAQSGSSLGGLLLPLILFGAMYLFLIRPQRARQKSQQRMLADLGVGDRIMTAGGIFGLVVAMDQDAGRVTVELAPGVHVEMLRAAVRERIVDGEADARP
ncbi:MAG: preprotein translocase subunit YajC [Actinomycetota bacterium]